MEKTNKSIINTGLKKRPARKPQNVQHRLILRYKALIV